MGLRGLVGRIGRREFGSRPLFDMIICILLSPVVLVMHHFGPLRFSILSFLVSRRLNDGSEGAEES
jgi:hypothetical protein